MTTNRLALATKISPVTVRPASLIKTYVRCTSCLDLTNLPGFQSSSCGVHMVTFGLEMEKNQKIWIHVRFGYFDNKGSVLFGF